MKTLYEEALADVKDLREAAIKDAQQRVLEGLTPRIRALIDNQLLNQEENPDADDDDVLLDMAVESDDADVLPVQATSQSKVATYDQVKSASTSGITTTIPKSQPPVIPSVPPAPPADGQMNIVTPAPSPAPVACPTSVSTVAVVEPVVQDAEPAPEVVQTDVVEPVMPVSDDVSVDTVDAVDDVDNTEDETEDDEHADFEADLYQVGESLKRLEKSTKTIRESTFHKTQVSQLVSVVENMYDYVQETMRASAQKTRLEERLESYYKKLNNLKEGTTMSKKQTVLKEEDVTLKLTGLPDDLNLEDLGVDLIAGEDEEGEGEEIDLDVTDDTSDSDVSDTGEGDASGEEDVDLDLEFAEMSDDTVVEIDEKMLQTELARIRESKKDGKEGKMPKNNTHGKKLTPKVADDFGGGKVDDLEINESTTTSDTASLKEYDEEVEGAGCEMQEAESCIDEMQNDDVVLTRESKIQKALVKLGASLKKQIKEAKDKKTVAKLSEQYNVQRERYSRSVARAEKVKARLAEGAKKVGSNSQPKTDDLRRKLSENLDSVKLQYANEVLQSQLSNAKKLRIIEKLDEARSAREAKLVYESSKLFESANEGEKERSVILGGSRPTKSGSASATVVNESVEVDRWARLAGLK